MRKRIAFCAVLFALALSCFILAACSQEQTGQLEDYTYTYHGVFEDEHDSTVSIDGSLDDAIWQNKSYFTNTAAATNLVNDVHIGVTAAMTQKGVYVGAYATDSAVQYLSPFNERNTNWRFYITMPEVEEYNAAIVKSFRVDLETTKSTNGAHVSSEAVWDEETGRFTVELFVSWRALGVDTSVYEGGVPDAIKLYTVYRVVADASGNSYYDIYSGFGGTTEPTMYPLYDADGYTLVDAENAVVGDAYNGYAKTNAWDISKEAEGEVSVAGDNWQVIFFREAYSSSFAAETYVEYRSGEFDSYSKLGLLALIDPVNFRAMLLNTATSNVTANPEGGYAINSAGIYGLTYYPSAMWDLQHLVTDGTVDMAKYGNKVKLKMVKDGSRLYYFVNDTFVYAEVCQYMEGDALAGFYALGSDAVFSDYRYADLAGDEEALAQELSGAVRIQTSYGVGGSLSADAIAVKSGGSFALTFENWAGYVLDSVTINGTERLTQLAETAQDGVMTLADVDEDVAVAAQFAPLSAAETATFRILDNNGSPVSATVLIESTSNELHRWQVSAPASAAGYTISLPAGRYTATIDSPGLRRLVYEFEVAAGGENAYAPQLELAMIGNVETDDFSVASSQTGWDYSEEYLGVMNATSSANWQFVYFTGHYDDTAVIEMTVTNATPSGTDGREDYSGLLWTVYNGSERLSVGPINARIRNYPGGVYTPNYENLTGYVYSNTFGSPGNSVSLVFARQGNTYYFFERNGSRYSLVYTYENSSVNGDAIYGFTITADETKIVNLRFSDMSICSGADAEERIAGLIASSTFTSDLFGDVTVNNTTLETNTGIFSVAKETDGSETLTGTNGAFSAAWFKDASTVSDTVLIETTVENLEAGSDGYPQAGFMVSDGTNKIALTLIAQRVRVFPNGVYTSSFIQSDPVLTNSLQGGQDNTGPVRVAFIRYEGTYYFFEVTETGGEKAYRYLWELDGSDPRLAPIGSAAAAYGLTLNTTSGTVTFSDTSVLAGTAAEESIQAILASREDPNFEGTYFGSVTVGGSTLHTAEADFDFSAEASGTVTATANSNTKRAWFKDSASDTALIRMTVTNHQATGFDQWSAIGFTLFDGTNYVDILSINGKVRVWPSGSGSNVQTSDPVMTNVGSATPVEMAYIRYEGEHYIFEYKDGAWALCWSSDASYGIAMTGSYTLSIAADAAAAYGIRFNSGGSAEDVELSGISIAVGSAATSAIEEILASLEEEPEPEPDTTYNGTLFGTAQGDGFTTETQAADFDFSAEASGTVTATMSSNNKRAWFINSYSDTALIQMTVQNNLPAGCDPYAAVGFTVYDGTNYFDVLTMYGYICIFDDGGSSYVRTGTALPNLGTTSDPVTIVYIRSGGHHYFLEKQADGSYTLCWSSDVSYNITLNGEYTDPIGTAAAVYGIRFRTGGSAADVDLNNISIAVGSAATSAIEGILASLEEEPEPEPDMGIFGSVTVNEVTLDTATDVFAEADGVLTAKNGTIEDRDHPGDTDVAWFKDVVSDTVLIQTTITSLYSQGGYSDGWPQAGVYVSDGTNKFAVTLIAQKVRVFYAGLSNSDSYVTTSNAVMQGSLQQASTDAVEIAFIRYNGEYYLFEKVGSAWVERWASNSDVSMTASYTLPTMGESAYGLVMNTTSGAVTFTDTSVQSGTDAESAIQAILGQSAAG